MVAITQELEKRQYYGCTGYGYYYSSYDGCYYSGWYAYGRWILVAAIVVVAFLLFLLFSCITARRRRRAGRQPFPMTGWASRPPPGQPYNNNQGIYNQGGYGGQQTYPQQEYGVAQPQPVYNNRDMGAGAYAPPTGPPPGKKN